MKKIIIIFLLIMFFSIIDNAVFLENAESVNTMINNMDSESIRVLVIIPDRFGANTFFNLDNMELFGWNVTLTGITDIVEPCQWARQSLGIPPITVDILIDDILDISDFEVVAIMPSLWRSGDAYGDLINSQHSLDLLSSANDYNIVIWATCAGVRVLAAADILQGVNVTGREQFKDEYERAGAIFLGEKIPPVIDGNIVTSMRGQYWNLENIQAIATALENLSRITCENVASACDIHTIVACSDNNVWKKTYGGVYADGGRSICLTPEGGFIVVGYTYSFGLGYSDIYVVCLNETGEMIWSKTFGDIGWEYGYSICSSHDDGYLLVGYSTSFGNGSKDFYVVKIGYDGDLIWSETYGGSGLDVGMSSCLSNEDCYLICGYTESFGSGEDDIYVIKINNDGGIIWENQYGGSGAELGYQIKPTSDGHYIVIGASGSDKPNFDCFLIKIDEDGNVLWENTFGFPGGEGGYDRGHGVIELDDGGFLVVGETNFGDALNMLVVRTDGNGDVLWAKTFGERLHDHGNDIIETIDGNFVLCGRVDKSIDGVNDLCLIKIDSEGNQLWKRVIDMSGSEWGCSVRECDDEGFFVCGHTDSFGNGDYDVFVMKTDSFGDSNLPPGQPTSPSGPVAGKTGNVYTYRSVSVDVELDDVYYLFDWGDGSDRHWIGPFDSGDECSASHIWSVRGDYEIRVKAKDEHDAESDWSDPLVVSMPKQYRFPMLYWLLGQYQKLANYFLGKYQLW